jgi:glycosyltransferase involved in cell wall biosynthesis
MRQSPSISVLIPAYNRAAFLPRTLLSVFTQTVPVEEVVLVDDGSTDNTAEVVNTILTERPEWRSRLHYVRQENMGKSVALNRALALARGEWIAYLDSDDRWLPDKLEWQFRALSRFPECRACFTESSLFEFDRVRPEHARRLEQDGPLGRVHEPSWMYVGHFPGTYMQTVVVRRDAMEECGEFDPRLRMEQDADFLFRLGFVTDFCYVALPLVEINRSPERGGLVGLGTQFRSMARLSARETRLQRWLSIVGDSSPAMRMHIKHELASQRSELVNRLLIADDPSSARAVLGRAMRECFELRLLIKWLLVWTAPSLLRALARARVPPEFRASSTGAA